MVKAEAVALVAIAVASCGLSACAKGNALLGEQPIALESETIRYETSPCFGTCPVYAVTLTPDGKGTFEGKRFTAVIGVRSFHAKPAAYRAFVAKMVPYRPTGNELLYQPGTPNCDNAPTDMPSVDVVWTELSGWRQHLNVYYGCGTQEMQEALRAAPAAIPIWQFIGGKGEAGR